MGMSPQKASAADSAAMVANAVRRGSVSVAAKNKAAPSLRQFNDAKKKEKGHDKGHRRNSRVIVMEDEPGGAAEKIERQWQGPARGRGKDFKISLWRSPQFFALCCSLPYVVSLLMKSNFILLCMCYYCSRLQQQMLFPE
jgi:hypothetical protein